MKTLKLSDEELAALVQLIDIAVKSQGLNVADAAVILANKVRQASIEPEQDDLFKEQVESSPQFAESVESPA